MMLAGLQQSVCLAVSAGLASLAWGETSISIGLVAGVAALLLAAAIIWMIRAGAPRLP